MSVGSHRTSLLFPSYKKDIAGFKSLKINSGMELWDTDFQGEHRFFVFNPCSSMPSVSHSNCDPIHTNAAKGYSALRPDIQDDISNKLFNVLFLQYQ